MQHELPASTSSATLTTALSSSLQKLAGVCVIAALSACTTVETSPQRGGEKVETASILPVPGGRGTSGDSGVFLAYAFRGTPNVSESGCRLRFIETTSRKSTFMNVRPGTAGAYVALAPGKYETGNMGCTFTRVYDMKGVLPGLIEVQIGSASYAGKLNFVFDGKDLSEVQKAPRPEVASGYSQALSVVPSGMPVVSAFSLAPLNEEMASEGAASNGWNVQGQGVPSGPALNALLADLRKCENQAGDPLRFGALNYRAAYKGGRFLEFKEQKNTNAFSESFRTCVGFELTKFRPPVKGEAEVSVAY